MKAQLRGEPDELILEKHLNLRVQQLKNHLNAFLAEVETLADVSGLDIEQGINLQKEVRRFEIDLIRLALKSVGGNQRRAASMLDIKPTTLNAKIKVYGLSMDCYGYRIKRNLCK
jgi:DNA-binding NtrC family response regulator